MIELIPAIDIIDGKCVRLTQGDYNRSTKYSDNPLDIAKSFEEAGINRLHLVDLDGAKASHVVNLKVLDSIASSTEMIIDFGGGIKSDDDIQSVFDHGASMVTIGSLAVTDFSKLREWFSKYKSDKFIIGADVKNGEISIHGWLESGGIDLFTFIDRYIACGITKILCTDISRDGMLSGPSIKLYKEILQRHPDIELIASGGVRNIDDIRTLESSGVPSVVFGKAFYEGFLSLEEISSYNK